MLRADGRRGAVAPPARRAGAAAPGARRWPRYALLGPADRLRAARGALALRRLDPADPRSTAQTLGAFLRRHGQNDATIAALWGIVATATLNLRPDEASLALAAKVFRTGLLDHAPRRRRRLRRVRRSATPLASPRPALERAGVEVLLPPRRAGRPGRYRARSTTTSGRRSVARPTRSCSPCPHARRVRRRARSWRSTAGRAGAPARRVADRQRARDLRPPGHRPAVRRRRRLTGAVVLRPHRPSGLRARTRRAVPGRDGFRGRRRHRHAQPATCASSSLPNWRGCCRRPAAREVLDAFVTRERRATFRQAAGSAATAPGAATSASTGIRLAGAWTATGWPDTMESAVRSGIAAAPRLR